MQVTSMYRYAIKGLSGDPIGTPSEGPLYLKPGETFPDDRRFALLKEKDIENSTEEIPPLKFDPKHPQWLHKENFLCAFSAPELMATFDTEYTMIDNEDNDDEESTIRQLNIWKRDLEHPRSDHLLGPLNLSNEADCIKLSNFFTSACGHPVHLVSQNERTPSNPKGTKHTHQFGNTRSGVRERNDTRTVHIVNAATVRQVSERIGIPLSPLRFRPNIVVDGWEPWMEFEAVGKSIQCYHETDGDCVRNDDQKMDGETLILDIISKTVRCEGIGIDPFHPIRDDEENQKTLDIPKLLQEFFPEHGPYLGVYAVVREGGYLCEGSRLRVIDA